MIPERTSVVRVRTPEGVSFRFRLASPVLRASAMLIDWAVIMAVWSTVATFVGLLRVISPDVAGLVGTVGFFVLSLAYDIFGEYRWRGQTVGKRLLRLRVVDAQGLRLTLAQIVLRNLLRFIDRLPLLYLVGGIAMLLNRRSQRLGDLAADTLVIWEPPQPEPDLAALLGEKYNSLREQTPVVARLRQAIGPGQARAAWAAIARRDQLDATERVRLFAELAAHFRAVGAVPPDVAEGISDEQFVRNVVDVLFVSR